MNLQMFQFIFISMAFHYGVEMNGYKTTGNTERKLCGVVQAVWHHAQITHAHTQRAGLNVPMLSRRHYIYRRARIYICWHSRLSSFRPVGGECLKKLKSSKKRRNNVSNSYTIFAHAAAERTVDLG